jgi:ABC-type transporter Mla subunit MlaD
MAIENRINLEIDSTKQEAITTNLNGLKTELEPLLVALPADEKKNLATIGERLMTFVEQAVISAEANPNLVPPYIQMDGVKTDIQAWKTLNNISKELEYLQSLLNDTAALSGSEAYSSMLSFYNYLKQAAKDGVPGAKALYDKLKHHFSSAKKKEDVKPEEN